MAFTFFLNSNNQNLKIVIHTQHPNINIDQLQNIY